MEEFRKKVYFDMMDYFIAQKRQAGDRPSQKEPPSRRSEPGKKQNRLRLISTPDDF